MEKRRTKNDERQRKAEDQTKQNGCRGIRENEKEIKANDKREVVTTK